MALMAFNILNGNFAFFKFKWVLLVPKTFHFLSFNIKYELNINYLLVSLGDLDDSVWLISTGV